MILQLVIHPDDAEFDRAFRFDKTFQQAGRFILGMSIDQRFDRSQNFFYGLKEKGLICVLSLSVGQNSFKISIHDKNCLL